MKGYTLIELIVAVGLFALIMTLVSGAFIMMISLDRQTQDVATGIDNLSFALETMTRTIRTGTTYSCNGGGDCASGGTTFSVTNTSGTSVSYALSNGVITQNSVPLTDPSVHVSSLTFYASGTSKTPTDYTQPYVTMIVSGSISSTQRKTQSFTVETSATMRGTDIGSGGGSSGSASHLLTSAMTSNSTPSPYSVTASSVYQGSTNIVDGLPYYDSFRAFDQKSSAFGDNAWLTNNVSTGWIAIYLGGTSSAATSYQITNWDSVPSTSAPKNWTFEGSNDGSSWTVLDTQSNQSWTSSYQTQTYTISNTTSYTWYRLNVSANNGFTDLAIHEIAIYGY